MKNLTVGEAETEAQPDTESKESATERTKKNSKEFTRVTESETKEQSIGSTRVSETETKEEIAVRKKAAQKQRKKTTHANKKRQETKTKKASKSQQGNTSRPVIQQQPKSIRDQVVSKNAQTS